MTAVATKLKELEARVTWLEQTVQELRDATQPASISPEEEVEMESLDLAPLSARSSLRTGGR